MSSVITLVYAVAIGLAMGTFHPVLEWIGAAWVLFNDGPAGPSRSISDHSSPVTGGDEDKRPGD